MTLCTRCHMRLHRKIKKKKYKFSKNDYKNFSFKLDNCFLHIRLTNKDRNEINTNICNKYNYPTHYINWQKTKYILNKSYNVITNNKGTFILNKGENFKEFYKIYSYEQKMNNCIGCFINWMENEWNKQKILIDNIKIILDIGTITFNKMLKTTEIKTYFKNNRYTVGRVKGSKNKYLRRY